MKKLLAFCCLLFPIMASAQSIDEPFGYPIKPGTKEWSEIRNETDRFKAMQIPDNILSNLTTSALVISCINFPAFGYITAYDNLETGYKKLETKFNGLRELSQRKDAGKIFIEVYQNSDINGSNDQNLNIDERYWPIRFTWIELLMAQNYLIESLGENEKDNILLLAKEKYLMKQSSKDYSVNSLLPTTLLMARILHSLAFSDFESEYSKNVGLRDFISTSILSDKEIFELVFNLNLKYLNS